MSHTETYIDGVWFPSVTTITGSKPKPWLDKWFAKHPVWAPKKTRAANHVGSAFHKCVEDYVLVGGYAPRTPRVARMMESFCAWAKETDASIDSTELKVISRTHRYSGTLDAVGRLGGRPCLFDWKSSSGIYDDMGLQLAAYAEAYREMTGVSCETGLIVLVNKKRPHKLETREFNLNKTLLGKFLRLRSKFGDMPEVAA